MAWQVLDAHEVDLDEIDRFCSSHGVETALMAEHVHAMRYNPNLRDFLLCVLDEEEGNIAGVCWIGGNIVPVAVPEAALGLLVREIRRRGRRYTSIVGPTQQVRALWRVIGSAFGRARDIRECQPHLEINTRPAINPDPLVTPTPNADFDLLFPAAVAMFTEEVGYSPLASGGRIPHFFGEHRDRKSTRLNSSHVAISYAVFCLKTKTDCAPAHCPTTPT